MTLAAMPFGLGLREPSTEKGRAGPAPDAASRGEARTQLRSRARDRWHATDAPARFHYNIAKRMLIHIAGFNLGLLMRKRFGVGTPRGLQGRLAAATAALVALSLPNRSRPRTSGWLRTCGGPSSESTFEKWAARMTSWRGTGGAGCAKRRCVLRAATGSATATTTIPHSMRSIGSGRPPTKPDGPNCWRLCVCWPRNTDRGFRCWCGGRHRGSQTSGTRATSSGPMVWWRRPRSIGAATNTAAH
jgi:hypothetical protein